MLPKVRRGFFRITPVKFICIFLFSVWFLYMHYMKIYKLTTGQPLSYVKRPDVKYILQWTRRYSAPFDFMGESNSAFIKNNCKYTNCYVTDDSEYFADVTDFDAIAFNGRDVIHLWPFMMPHYRSPKQKYIFGAMESPDNFPACYHMLDGLFNWTWTYRLDSDFRWGYITIYDLEGNVVGPAIDMKWPKLNPINQDLKDKLSSKKRAAAWFVSHCHTTSGREVFVSEVQEELRVYGWTVDIYGSCGTFSCPRSQRNECFELIEQDYFFYFSLENSFAEDYVTEKLLTALNNYAVPVVYGAANYSR